MDEDWSSVVKKTKKVKKQKESLSKRKADASDATTTAQLKATNANCSQKEQEREIPEQAADNIDHPTDNEIRSNDGKAVAFEDCVEDVDSHFISRCNSFDEGQLSFLPSQSSMFLTRLPIFDSIKKNHCICLINYAFCHTQRVDKQ